MVDESHQVQSEDGNQEVKHCAIQNDPTQIRMSVTNEGIAFSRRRPAMNERATAQNVAV